MKGFNPVLADRVGGNFVGMVAFADAIASTVIRRHPQLFELAAVLSERALLRGFDERVAMLRPR